MYNCGYILLKNKEKNIYNRAFAKLKKTAFELNYLLKHKLVLLDFDKAAISAVKEVFDCEVIGCYFHFIQSLWKNIQTKGLTTEYRTDASIKNWVFLYYKLIIIIKY